jgi:hypothetical protein
MTILRELLEAEAAVGLRAVPARTVRHVHAGEDPWLVVLFQYAAEPYSLVAIAAGPPAPRPAHRVLCPRPLDRRAVADRAAGLRDGMLEWLYTYPVTTERGRDGRPHWRADQPPQLLLPSVGTASALDDLAYAWRYTAGLDPAWPQLGWELWALLQLRDEPGAGAVVTLDTVLPEHWAFGISALEAANIAVDVALLDAGPGGVPRSVLADAEDVHVGPLDDPEQLDAVLWRLGGEAGPAAQRAAWKVVRTELAQTLGQAWRVSVRAWQHLSRLPAAPSAAARHAAAARQWAWRVGPLRAGDPAGRQRRAVPALGRAAREVVRLERALDIYATSCAAEDPLVAAELAADGKAVHGQLVSVATRQVAPRRRAVDLLVETDQLVVPATGSLLALDVVVGRLVRRDRRPGGWSLTLSADRRGLPGTAGVRAAAQLLPGEVWLLPALDSGPPVPPDPPRAPVTHPRSVFRP